DLDMDKDQSRHPIFQVTFALQSFGTQENKLFKQVCGDDYFIKVTRFDIECFIDDSRSMLEGSFNYATSLYSKETIQRLVKSYERILIQLTESQTTK
ncbi:condensation domain-containing protein, partial [Francisella philomiragia]|uniref:condensation domain-containing protein n=1 Tax=Francisella philomiragia TaxID=28110 RepID=UPI001907D3B3